MKIWNANKVGEKKAKERAVLADSLTSKILKAAIVSCGRNLSGEALSLSL